MHPITDINEFLQELRDFKKHHAPFITNFYIFNDKLHALVHSRRLFFTVSNECFLIFQDKGDYLQLYYCISLNNKLYYDINIDIGKPLISWYITNDIFTEKDNIKHTINLERLGFHYLRKTYQFSFKLEELEARRLHVLRIISSIILHMQDIKLIILNEKTINN